MAKTKTDQYKPFPGVVCERLRRLSERVRECEDSRKRAFKRRDFLRSEIANATGAEAERLKAERNDVIDQIEVLAAEIKWANDEINDAVMHADTPDRLFPDLDVPDFTAKLVEKAERAAKKGDEDEDVADEPEETEETDEAPLAYESSAAAAEPARGKRERSSGTRGADDSIENYLPGRYTDQNGGQHDLADFAALQRYALEKGGPEMSLTPSFSASWGVRVDIIGGDGAKVGCLSYAGPIPEGAKRGRGRKGDK